MTKPYSPFDGCGHLTFWPAELLARALEFFTVLRDPIDWSLVYASFSIDPNAVMVYEHSIATYGGMYELGYQRLK